jgi:hypothetical protein
LERDELMDGPRIFGFIFCLVVLIAAVHAQTLVDDALSTVSEDTGPWRLSFNWSVMDEYGKSVSHGDSKSGNVKISTDAITMTSSADKAKVIRITIMKYSSKDPGLVNLSSQIKLAKDSLSKSGVCADIIMENRTIDGRPAIVASGIKCLNGETIYAAVYPIDYRFDRPGGILGSNAMGLIISSFGQQATERLLDSIRIEQRSA